MRPELSEFRLVSWPRPLLSGSDRRAEASSCYCANRTTSTWPCLSVALNVDTPASGGRVRTAAVQALMATCPICGEDEFFNTEDILPSWLRRYAVNRSDHSGDFVGAVDGVPYRRPEPFTIQVGIGKPCNTWMGSKFQSPAKPVLVRLIEHSDHVLDSTDLMRVARWVAMTALVDALRFPNRPADSVYRAFRNSGQPPDGCRVLIGSYVSPGVAPPTRMAFLARRQPQAGEPQRVSFLPLGLLVGQLVIVLSMSVEGPPVRTIAERTGRLVEIYPDTPRSLRWPREIAIDSDGLQDAFTWEVVRSERSPTPRRVQ